MNPYFIRDLQKRRCNYNHPDQATSQANSLVLLSSGIYTEEERFVFELLQNAVDAHSEKSNLLDVKMIIKEGYFIYLRTPISRRYSSSFLDVASIIISICIAH